MKYLCSGHFPTVFKLDYNSEVLVSVKGGKLEIQHKNTQSRTRTNKTT